MKALVMAGGQGSRLRPLTCDRPKPMVPILNEPVMAHILRVLARTGIRDVFVTLHPMPELVQAYFGDGEAFGLRLHYLVEPVPLGTAGSAAQALPFLDGTLLVISGDAFTDIDLTGAVEFHRAAGALATLVLKRVADATEYGVVVTDAAGRIVRFQEKPSPSELISDQANTGIYLLEPQALARVPAGRPCDFSQDLFPALLRSGEPIYGWLAPQGYWCDVGSPEQYRQTHLDVMGAWPEDRAVQVAPDCRVAAGAHLRPPVLLGPGCQVEQGAEVGPFACLGPQCYVGPGASVRHSVLWKGCHLGQGAEVRGAVLADGVVVGRGARIFEGAVLGCQCRVGEGAVVGPGVRLWPDKQVEAHEHLTRPLVWNGAAPRTIFGPLGVRGETNAAVTPELALGLAGAFAGRLAPGEGVVVAHSGQPAARALAWAAASGVSAAGCRVVWLDAAAAPLARRVTQEVGQGAVYVSQEGEESRLSLWDGRGRDLPGPEARAVDQALRRQEWRRAGAGSMGDLESGFELHARALADYLERLRRWCGQLLQAWPQDGRAADRAALARVQLQGEGPGAQLARRALRELGLEAGQPAIFAAELSPDGQELRLATPGGRRLGAAVVEDLACLVAALGMRAEVPVPLPGSASQGLEASLARLGRRVVRVALHPAALAAAVEGSLPVHPLWDGVALLCGLAVLAAQVGGGLQGLVRAALPAARLELEVPVSLRRLAPVMRELAQERDGARRGSDGLTQGAEGLWWRHETGAAVVCPRPERAALQLRVEAATLEDAAQLLARYHELLRQRTRSWAGEPRGGPEGTPG